MTEYTTTGIQPTCLPQRAKHEGRHAEAEDSEHSLPAGSSIPTFRVRKLGCGLELACEVAGITFGVDLVPPEQLLGDVLTLEDLA